MSSMLSKTFAAALLSVGLAVPAFAQQLSLSASPNPSQVGQSIGVDVVISGIADLYGYQFTLNYNPALLMLTSSSEGSFLSSAGATYGDAGTVDNSGMVSAFYTLLTAVPGATGSGTLIHMNFTALAAGTATLSFAGGDATLFLNSQGSDIAVTATPKNLTLVTAVPEPTSLALLMAGLGFVAWRRRANA